MPRSPEWEERRLAFEAERSRQPNSQDPWLMRGLGLATATTSAAFLPHLEQRIS